MSVQHRGHFQYWKPSRPKMTYSEWSRRAWLIALALTLLVFAYVVGATLVMLLNLPPEVPR